MVDRTVSIYVLRDASGAPKYVGQTTDPKGRLWRHWRESQLDAKHPNPALKSWLVSLAERPVMDVVEVVPHGIRHAVEREWTITLREAGHDLLNVANGASVAPETAAKIADSLRGTRHSAETRQRMSASARQRLSDPTARQRLSEVNRGKVVSLETRQRISEATRLAMRSPEVHQKVVDANRRRVTSPETRKKLSDAHRGKPKSEETKAKMREAAQRRVARQRAQREVDGQGVEETR